MKTMQSGHGIIETVKEDLPSAPSQERGRIGIEAVVELSRPLNVFIQKEDSPQKKGNRKKENGQISLSIPYGGNGKGHGQTAGKKDQGIDGSKNPIQFSCRQMKIDRIFETVNRIKNKEPSEEENLREEEKPHPDFRTGVIFMLFHVFCQCQEQRLKLHRPLIPLKAGFARDAEYAEEDDFWRIGRYRFSRSSCGFRLITKSFEQDSFCLSVSPGRQKNFVSALSATPR
jgi:hypothetical protein